ncbi:hypothetical protein HNO89_000120 [Sporosarcina luteola]|nr:hypothetical protein [Sporosarcina luteola]
MHIVNDLDEGRHLETRRSERILAYGYSYCESAGGMISLLQRNHLLRIRFGLTDPKWTTLAPTDKTISDDKGEYHVHNRTSSKIFRCI